MGAQTQLYRTDLKGPQSDKVLQEEHRKLVAQACWDYGHAGYTGTIAESPGLRIVRGADLNDEDEAYEWLHTHSNKWEESLAFQIGNTWYIGGTYSS